MAVATSTLEVVFVGIPWGSMGIQWNRMESNRMESTPMESNPMESNPMCRFRVGLRFRFCEETDRECGTVVAIAIAMSNPISQQACQILYHKQRVRANRFWFGIHACGFDFVGRKYACVQVCRHASKCADSFVEAYTSVSSPEEDRRSDVGSRSSDVGSRSSEIGWEWIPWTNRTDIIFGAR